MKDKKVSDTIRVRNTPGFKLKDRPGRQYVKITFMKVFGFIPETIIVEKIIGSNNGLVVRAVLTDKEIELEDKRIKNSKALENK